MTRALAFCSAAQRVWVKVRSITCAEQFFQTASGRDREQRLVVVSSHGDQDIPYANSFRVHHEHTFVEVGLPTFRLVALRSAECMDRQTLVEHQLKPAICTLQAPSDKGPQVRI